MTRPIYILTILIFSSLSAISQVSYYADTYKGGITGGGYAPNYDGGGTGTINVSIAPGSTIRKAILFAGRHGAANTAIVTLNGSPFTFNNTNQVSPTFTSIYGGASGVHAADVTTAVSAGINAYTLAVPVQNAAANNRYTDFYLFIAYDNASLPTISTEFFVNDKNFSTLANYTFNLTKAVNSSQPVAVGCHLGYMCSASDNDLVSLNGTSLGSVNGPESNSGSCAGPFANFYYRNNTVSALGDDNANQAMNAADVLSNAQALIPNNSTSFTMQFTHSSSDNSRWGFFIASGEGCTLPVATVVPADTAICYGNFVQLNASGGTNYRWTPATGINDSTSASPTAYPQNTTTYTVTVSDNCGSTTGVAKITVHPAPPTPTILESNDTLYCSIHSTYTAYQWYFNNNLIPGATTTNYFATKSGNYNVGVTDVNGCVISVGINIVVNGISEYHFGNSIAVYPNPSSDKVHLVVPGIPNGSEIRLSAFNVLGETLLKEPIKWNEAAFVNISSLAPGIYFLQLEGKSERWVGMFIKE